MKDKRLLEKSPQAASAGWRSFMSFSPDKKTLVTVNQFADRLDIYHVENGKLVTTLGEEHQEPRFQVHPDGYGVPLGGICHYDVQVTERYIYSIYDGRSFSETMKQRERYQGGKLFRIYTHDGKLVAGYQLDRYITGIYVDETTSMLYGLDVNADEQIVKFPAFRLP